MLSIIARMVTYVGTVASIPVLRRKFSHRPKAFRLPGGNIIPVIALLLCLIFLVSATIGNLVAGSLALLVGAGVYYFRSLARPDLSSTDVQFHFLSSASRLFQKLDLTFAKFYFHHHPKQREKKHHLLHHLAVGRFWRFLVPTK